MEICYNGVWGTVCADNGWDEVAADVVCQQLGITYQKALPINDSSGASDGPVLLENVSCSNRDTNLSQCVDFAFIGASRHCRVLAGVICMLINASTEQFPTASVYVTTTNKSHDSTYKVTSTTSDSSESIEQIRTTTFHTTIAINTLHNSSIIPIIYGATSGVLVIIGAIATVAIVITVVAITRKRERLMQNR